MNCTIKECLKPSKLALSDEILMKIEKPARYIGGEVNAVIKDREKVEVRFAMCFPDVYEKNGKNSKYSEIVVS